MTAIAPASRGNSAVRTLLLCLGLGLAVTVRWQVFHTAALDGITEGLVFGSALLSIAWVGGSKLSAPPIGAVAAGIVAGAALVAVSLLARDSGAPLVLAHAAPFLPWVVVTAFVAIGEELVLRGVLWRRLAAAGGDVAALLATSLLFALIHVPVYGWTVVPLDLGVGLWFGGLRLWFGGPTAPAVAHVLADLATWWL